MTAGGQIGVTELWAGRPQAVTGILRTGCRAVRWVGVGAPLRGVLGGVRGWVGAHSLTHSERSGKGPGSRWSGRGLGAKHQGDGPAGRRS